MHGIEPMGTDVDERGSGQCQKTGNNWGLGKSGRWRTVIRKLSLWSWQIIAIEAPERDLRLIEQ